MERQPARPEQAQAPPSGTIFLVLRRMRTPLIALILIFAVTVLGLSLIPGVDDQGNPYRLTLFEAFYVVSYTASTIGFGELPYPFTDAQRMWILLTIYLTVIGWAYAIGSLLTLLQDRAFRTALAVQRFSRRVRRLRDPFLLVAGYGNTGELLGKAWDALGRGFVAVDVAPERIDSLDIDPYAADPPGLVADAANPANLDLAGLRNPWCEGVLAFTNDDEANLTVTMTAALLRPDLRVIARTTDPAIEDRMNAFGTPTVVNPFDRFGDHLRVAVRAPVTFQLLTWFEGGPGAQLPPRGDPPHTGRWVVCGYGSFGREVISDLGDEGLPVTVIEPDPQVDGRPSTVRGDASEPEVMAKADLAAAVGFVAATSNDTTNLSLVAAARRHNRDLYTVARQNEPANAPLFAAMGLDLLLVPSEVVAREAYARLSTPLLWRFLQEIPLQGEDWATALLHRLTRQCDTTMQDIWKVELTAREAPAVSSRLRSGDLTLGAVLRDSADRERLLPVTPLMLLRGDDVLLRPDLSTTLRPGDELLMLGTPSVRRAFDTTLLYDATAEYVITGLRVPSGWVWRHLSRAWSTRRSGTPG